MVGERVGEGVGVKVGVRVGDQEGLFVKVVVGVFVFTGVEV